MVVPTQHLHHCISVHNPAHDNLLIVLLNPAKELIKHSRSSSLISLHPGLISLNLALLLSYLHKLCPDCSQA